MTVKYHLGRVVEGLQPKPGYKFFLRREGPGNGKLSAPTFEGLIIGMIDGWLPQDINEGLEIILNEKTLTTDQIKLVRLVENLARRYEEGKKLYDKPLYQLTNHST